MPARKGPHYQMSREHRDKIANSNILNALIEHAVGEREMSSTQVQAGLGLLKKVMPDLASVQLSGDDENPVQIEISERAKSVRDRILGAAARIEERGDTGQPE